MASAKCSAISSELGVLGENITQEGLFLGNEGLGRGVWLICQQWERILILSAWSREDRTQRVSLPKMG